MISATDALAKLKVDTDSGETISLYYLRNLAAECLGCSVKPEWRAVFGRFQ